MRQWDLEQRIDEGSDSSSLCKDDETSEQPQTDDDGKQPEFLPCPHVQPKLRQEFHFFPLYDQVQSPAQVAFIHRCEARNQ